MNLILVASLAAFAAPVADAARIVLSNDNGWATTPVRLLFAGLSQNHDVVLSGPAEDKSGKGK